MTKFDLEERAFMFAQKVRDFTKETPQTVANKIYISQVIRSSGSIGANYLEANDALGKADFLHRLRISRKEAKETIYWLRLFDVEAQVHLENIRGKLLQEATELRLILSAILINSQKKK
jgi:four helix bundle protein